MKSLALEGLSSQLVDMLKTVGNNIRLARKRRRMPLAELAERSHVSIGTLAALERGAPGVGIGILLRVLSILKLHEDFTRLADPGHDAIGLAEEARRAPQRVHALKSLEDEL